MFGLKYLLHTPVLAEFRAVNVVVVIETLSHSLEAEDEGAGSSPYRQRSRQQLHSLDIRTLYFWLRRKTVGRTNKRVEEPLDQQTNGTPGRRTEGPTD